MYCFEIYGHLRVLDFWSEFPRLPSRRERPLFGITQWPTPANSPLKSLCSLIAKSATTWKRQGILWGRLDYGVLLPAQQGGFHFAPYFLLRPLSYLCPPVLRIGGTCNQCGCNRYQERE